MCGISGIISKDGQRHHAIADLMFCHQEKRGPDFGSILNHGDNIFAHNRLSIIDLSEYANQPIQTDRWILVYNGEIYNYKELKELLSGYGFKSGGDTETLLFMIDQCGVEMTLRHVEGMFAFAAYDKKEEVLWLAVDPMGIKPLYYYSDERFFAFASSPGALTHCKDKWELDEKALADYLALGATHESLFKGIKKVMPATMLKRESSGRTGIKKYYFVDQPKPKQTRESVLEAVKKSIQSVKVADVEVVMFLSGGIDSTVVASQCKGMKSIHLDSVETNYAQHVADVIAKDYENDLEIVSPSNYNAQECLEDYSRQSGDCSMSALIPYIVSKEVSEYAKVAISANGADELFFGYDRMTDDEETFNQFQHIFRGSISGGTAWDRDYGLSRQLELETYVQFDLNKTLDFASMCHGLEVRVPYLNISVVEAALALPRSEHVQGRYTKSILKDFLRTEGYGDDFLNRPKIGFSLFYQPEGYEALQVEGVRFLKSKGLHQTFGNNRDNKYFKASAAAFYCWYQVWKDKLIIP